MSEIDWSQFGFSTFSSEAMSGYCDGRADDRDEFPSHSNRSEAYRHGWLNGRDDRLGKPRATAQELRDIAADIEARTAS